MMWMFKMNWGVKMKWLVVLCFFVAVSTWSEYCMIVGQGECMFVSYQWFACLLDIWFDFLEVAHV